MKIAITGTTSGIGKALVDILELDHQVIQFIRPEYNLLDITRAYNFSNFDVLINNAGADYSRQEFSQHKFSDWSDTVNINFIVPMLLTQQFIQQNKTGIIVNVSSYYKSGSQSSIFYSSAKAGLKHFTENLDISGFRLIDVQPARTATNFKKNAGGENNYGSDSLNPLTVAQSIKYAIETPGITHIKLKADSR